MNRVEGLVGEDYGTTVSVLVVAVVWGVLFAAHRLLRTVRPWLWWPTIGAAVATWRMARSWRANCDELDLSIPGGTRLAVVGGGRRSGVILKGKPLHVIPPRRVGLWFSGVSLMVTVRLHPGQTPAQYEKAAEALSHAWRVHRVRAVSHHRGFVTLTGLGFDPLRYPPKPKRNAKRKDSGELTADVTRADVSRGGGQGLGSSDYGGPAVLVAPVGVREDGEAWVVDAGRHHLVTGATRSGKSTLTVRMIAELSRRPVCMVGIDAKNGMELSPFAARLSGLAVNRGEAAAALEAMVRVLHRQAEFLRDQEVRSIWDLPLGIRPMPIVIIVDEIAELFLSADKEGKAESNRCVTALIRLAQLGSALGIFLWVAGQRFGSDLGPGATLLRAQLAGRVCHRVADSETAGMTLAGLPSEAVTEAQAIAIDLPGVAVAGDDSGAWFLARSHPTSVADAVQVARDHAGFMLPLLEVTEAIDAVRKEGN